MTKPKTQNKDKYGTVAKHPTVVIPAEAGIHNINEIKGRWIPVFTGMTEKIISQQSQYVRFKNKRYF